MVDIQIPCTNAPLILEMFDANELTPSWSMHTVHYNHSRFVMRLFSKKGNTCPSTNMYMCIQIKNNQFTLTCTCHQLRTYTNKLIPVKHFVLIQKVLPSHYHSGCQFYNNLDNINDNVCLDNSASYYQHLTCYIPDSHINACF